MFDNFLSVVFGAISSALICFVIIATAKWHGRWSFDQVIGKQKFHQQPTPRIGGLALIGGALIAFSSTSDSELLTIFRPVLVCALIPFFFGFREDLTKKVSVFERMLAGLVAAGAVIWLTKIYLSHVDVWGIDALLSFTPLAIIFTLVAVSGLTNAINILDGFHGLASGTSFLIALTLALIALQVGDHDLSDMAFILAGCLLGFMVFNYPFGKIFLGDSGAYFTGFILAWLAILLGERNSEVSPWASLLVCAYPIWEALFSIFRRLKNKVGTTHADDLHLHTLLKRRLVRKHLGHYSARLRNAAVAPLIWCVTLILGFIAWQFKGSPLILMGAFFIFAVLYGIVYRALLSMPDIDVGIEGVSNSSDGGSGN
jgi:UDP-N-acetylmuramyl pentapeptide phosphotransferase/UDP-N-acetylglucosamine-1-phosphate transferase